MTRGSTRGTLTMAIWLSRPKASRPPSRAMKLSDLLATCGNGWLGSRLTGTSSGRTWVSKKRCTHLRCAALRSAWLSTTIPACCSAGISTSLNEGVLFVDEFVRSVGHRDQGLARDARARLPRGFDDVGHAHLEEFVEVAADDGDVAQPLEQRHVVAPGLGQHAAVELQDGALAVEQRQGPWTCRGAGSGGNGIWHHGP